MGKSTYKPITFAEMEELKAWAAVEGRAWKDALERHSWWRGIPARDKHGKDYPLLYGLRNTHGGAWLKSFRFPKP